MCLDQNEWCAAVHVRQGRGEEMKGSACFCPMTMRRNHSPELKTSITEKRGIEGRDRGRGRQRNRRGWLIRHLPNSRDRPEKVKWNHATGPDPSPKSYKVTKLRLTKQSARESVCKPERGGSGNKMQLQLEASQWWA